MVYADLSQVKAYMGISTSTDDALLTSMISRAEGLIDAYTDRHFAAVTETHYYTSEDVYDNDLLMFGDDLLSVTKLINGDGVEIPSANIKLLPRNTLPKWGIHLNSGFSWSFLDSDSEIAVTGTWGYSETPPADIEHACVRLTAFMYRQKDTSADIDRPIVTGDGVTLMPTNLPSDVTRLLDRYCRRIA